MFGVPLAMFPALLVGDSTAKRCPVGAGLLTMALGMVLTIVSSGWIAPAVVRRDSDPTAHRFLASLGRTRLRPALC